MLAHSECPFLSLAALGAGNSGEQHTSLIPADPASPVDGAQNPQTCQVGVPELQQLRLRARVNRFVLYIEEPIFKVYVLRTFMLGCGKIWFSYSPRIL